MHLAYILVFILFLIKKNFFLSVISLLPPGLLWVSGIQAPSACKTYKQPEELIASRKLVVDAAKWWMQLEWDRVSFWVRRRDTESKCKCFAAIKVCLIPNSLEYFLGLGVCVGLLTTGWFGLIEGVLSPREKSGTLLWRFLDSFTSSFETVLRHD